MLTTTLFDMDGLLVDSEILWHEAELDVFGAVGVNIVEESRSTKGMYVDDVVAYWYRRQPWTGQSEGDVRNLILQRVGELVRAKGELMPGAERALDLTAARGRTALASSTPRALIDEVLRHFGLLDRFGVICSAENEQFGKPHPAVFLSAAHELGVKPGQCLVFEDSAAGVLAARAASMTVVAVPDTHDRDLPEFRIAHLVLNSLLDLSEEWLDARFESPELLA